MNLDDQLRVGPGLATGWEQPDDLTYVVRLRRGVRFHDGRELTSADVAYTFNSLIDPAFVSARRGAYALLERVEAVDPYTARFVLKKPSGSFPIQLVLPIVPAGAGATLRTNPVGTGPYRLVRYAVDDRLELAAFADYYEGPPKNAGVVLKVVPDEIMRGLELEKGTVDLVINDLSPDTVAQLGDDGDMQVVTSSGTDYAYVGLNLREPLLEDRRVRHAIGHAIDREAIVKYLRRGLAQPAVGVVPPASWAFKADTFQFAYDPARAKRLLDEAGFPDPDGDGPASRVRLTLKVSTNEFYRLQAAVIQQDLAQGRHRTRCPELRVRHAVSGCRPRQFPTGDAAVGGHLRPRHAAASVSLEPGAAQRLQSRLLSESRGRSSDRSGDERARRRRALGAVRPGAAAGGGGRAVHQPLVQDELRRGEQDAGRGSADAARGFHLPEGRESPPDGQSLMDAIRITPMIAASTSNAILIQL